MFCQPKLFCLDIFDQLELNFTKTIIPLALIASESIAHSAFGLIWAIDSDAIWARGIIVNYSHYTLFSPATITKFVIVQTVVIIIIIILVLLL